MTIHSGFRTGPACVRSYEQPVVEPQFHDKTDYSGFNYQGLDARNKACGLFHSERRNNVSKAGRPNSRRQAWRVAIGSRCSPYLQVEAGLIR